MTNKKILQHNYANLLFSCVLPLAVLAVGLPSAYLVPKQIAITTPVGVGIIFTVFTWWVFRSK